MGQAVPANEKKGYQPLRLAEPGRAPGQQVPTKAKNVWQVVDDGFGSMRDFSKISGINAGASASGGGFDE